MVSKANASSFKSQVRRVHADLGDLGCRQKDDMNISFEIQRRQDYITSKQKKKKSDTLHEGLSTLRPPQAQPREG